MQHEKTLISKKLLKSLLNSGDKMSNICYNLSQDTKIDERHRQSMKQTQIEWDGVRNEYYSLKK